MQEILYKSSKEPFAEYLVDLETKSQAVMEAVRTKGASQLRRSRQRPRGQAALSLRLSSAGLPGSGISDSHTASQRHGVADSRTRCCCEPGDTEHAADTRAGEHQSAQDAGDTDHAARAL